MAEVSEAEARRRYIRGELDKVVPGGGQVKLKLLNAEGETFWLNITSDQQAAIEKILVPDAADNVSYAPCIIGKVDIGGNVSEFMLPLLNDSVTYNQWGGRLSDMGSRVDLMHRLADGAREWAEENLCRTCKENLLDDGEGYDGECGDCADRTEARKDEDDE